MNESTTHEMDREPRSIDEQRKGLPVYAVRDAIVASVRASPVLVVVGETGSGKTTQLPQFLLDDLGRPNIACTQPRRVAALTVAQRVAVERRCVLGEEVGYTVRFDDKTSRQTRLKYMTDGMLLRECLIDPSRFMPWVRIARVSRGPCRRPSARR